MLFRRIAIIGLGLIGGSIAKTVKRINPAVEIKATPTPLFELVQWADLAVIATPIDAVFEIAREIAGVDRAAPLIVIDVASVKTEIASLFEMVSNDKIEFLSTHPMAGKEASGYENSTEMLFEQAAWVLTPHRKNKKETIEMISKWIEEMGARPKILNAEKHDEQAALISHFPTLISDALLAFVNAQNPDALAIAGPGFRSMTRLAQGDTRLLKEFKEHNGKNLETLMHQFVEYIKNYGENKQHTAGHFPLSLHSTMETYGHT